MNETGTPLLSICCLAYNHEPFIRQCLDGFLMQKTDFPFEVLIHDDASTDKTADIIREYEAKYPNIIKPIYQTENQYSKGVKISTKYQYSRAKGKYIALCEGDDYWTDQQKLQKQVDFLEQNEEYSLCCHRYRIIDEATKEWRMDLDFREDYNNLFPNNCQGLEFDNKNRYWLCKTLTVVFRKEALNLNKINKYTLSRDVHLFYHILKTGKGYCMNYDAGVYRRHSGGIWSGLSELKAYYTAYLVYDEFYRFNRDDEVLYKRWQYHGKLLLNHIIKDSKQKKYIPLQIFPLIFVFCWRTFRTEGIKSLTGYLKRYFRFLRR